MSARRPKSPANYLQVGTWTPDRGWNFTCTACGCHYMSIADNEEAAQRWGARHREGLRH